MDATVRNLDGDDADTVELPAVFETTYRPDLIGRAVCAPRRQTENRTTVPTSSPAFERRPNRSVAAAGWPTFHDREGRARRVPQAVKGRKAHPPKAEKDQSESINTKAKKLAVRSAIAATTDAELVAERGHEFDEDVETPVVVDDEFEDLHKTQEVVDFLEAGPRGRHRTRRRGSQRPLRSGESPWPQVQDADIDPLRHIQRDRPVASGPEPRRCRRDDGRRGQRGGSRTRRTAGTTHRLDRERTLEEVADR